MGKHCEGQCNSHLTVVTCMYFYTYVAPTLKKAKFSAMMDSTRVPKGKFLSLPFSKLLPNVGSIPATSLWVKRASSPFQIFFHKGGSRRQAGKNTNKELFGS